MNEKIKKVIELVQQVKPSLQDLDESTVLNEGALDSLDIIALVTLMEKEFHVKIAGACLKQENFRSVVTLCGMVDKAGSK